jgi:glutathione S-transferase
MSWFRKPTVFGAPYSVSVRSVRLTREEKAIDYDLVPVDILAAGGPPAEHVARHPFGKIPAFEHDGFQLYEAEAITRYIDEAFAGVPLQPADVCRRARMTQIISILDSYAYRTLVWDIYVERVARSATGSVSDEQKIARRYQKQ